jgi:hypothetical protein
MPKSQTLRQLSFQADRGGIKLRRRLALILAPQLRLGISRRQRRKYEPLELFCKFKPGAKNKIIQDICHYFYCLIYSRKK